MTITLNPAALARLLESEMGPVGQDLRRRAENVAAQATENASVSGDRTLGIQTGDLHSGIRYEIGHDSDGLFATVGTDAQHGGVFYPTWWDKYGGKPWLSSALDAARD